MFLVVGSTGRLGVEICRILALKGIPIRALVRPTSDLKKIEQLINYGSQIVLGDLRNSLSLAEACQGMDGVICSASALNSYIPSENDFLSVDLEGILSLVERAKEASVPHFIFVSLSSNIDLESPLSVAKHVVEKHLQESGMVYTIIRPAFFMETWFSLTVGFDPFEGRAVIYGDGDHPIRWISLKDVARCAVNSLSNPIAYDAILELCGPQALGQLQVIRVFEEVFQQPFEITAIPENILYKRLTHEMNPLEQSWLSLFLCCAHGDRAYLQRSSNNILNQLMTVEDYAKSSPGYAHFVNLPVKIRWS